MSLLQISDLSVTFERNRRRIHAVSGVSFDVGKGEVVALLGESGCGKSVTLRSIMGLANGETAGSVRLSDVDVLAADKRKLRDLRGRIVSMVFQEPMTALDPVATIGRQLIDVLVLREGLSKADARRRAIELLELVQIPMPERRLAAYPHELSGGLRQRAMIAIAIALNPALLLADEPTTALDATVQIQVLLLLKELRTKLDMATIIVTHDIGVAAELADRVVVMYAGRVVETGSAAEVLKDPRHPYTRALLEATVHAHSRGHALRPLEGSPPDLSRPITGCAFAPRCRDAVDRCRTHSPSAVNIAAGREVRCLRLAEHA